MSFGDAIDRNDHRLVRRVARFDVRLETMIAKVLGEAEEDQASRVVEREGFHLGYVHVWSWAGEEVQETLRELLLAGELAQADGLVLDLRDGLGGANPDALALFSRELPKLTWTERDGTSASRPSSWTLHRLCTA